MSKDKEYCIYCMMPRSFYDLKIEPGYSNPDYKLGACCNAHTWKNETVSIAIKTLQEALNERQR